MMNLIKKDYLLVKRMFVLFGVIVFILPIFFYFVGRGAVMPLGLGLSVVSILTATSIMSAIYEEEEKYKKTTALLTAVGYNRDTQIKARYLLAYGIYLYCLIAFALVYTVFPYMGEMSITGVIWSLFYYTLMIGTYLLSTIVFGIRAGRLILIFEILLISLGPTIISTVGIKINLDILDYFQGNIAMAMILVISLAVLTLFFRLSLRIYRKKEL